MATKRIKKSRLLLIASSIILLISIAFISSPSLRKSVKQHLHNDNAPEVSFQLSKKKISGYSVFGIDVSQYQKFINWQKVVQNENIQFAFVRATAGLDHKDEYFSYNWASCSKYNIPKGAYHYYRPDENSLQQAENFIKHVRLTENDLPPVLDIEVYSNIQSLNSLKSGLLKWLQKVESHYHITPIVYTNHKFYKLHFSDDDRFNKYPFWLARYGTINNFKKPHSDWIFWQYSKSGKLEGIEGKVDLNVFSSDIESLKLLCK